MPRSRALYNGVSYSGVDNVGSVSGAAGKKHLVTLGWERAGALVGLFAPPHGPETPVLATPQFLFASDPAAKADDDPDAGDEGPSQRPYETLTALAAKLGLTDRQKSSQEALRQNGEGGAGLRRRGVDRLAA